MITLQLAFKKFLDEIEKKTSWGKREVKDLLLKCLVDAEEGKE